MAKLANDVPHKGFFVSVNESVLPIASFATNKPDLISSV